MCHLLIFGRLLVNLPGAREIVDITVPRQTAEEAQLVDTQSTGIQTDNTHTGNHQAGSGQPAEGQAGDIQAGNAPAGNALAYYAPVGNTRAGNARAGNARAGNTLARNARASNTYAGNTQNGDIKSLDLRVLGIHHDQFGGNMPRSVGLKPFIPPRDTLPPIRNWDAGNWFSNTFDNTFDNAGLANIQHGNNQHGNRQQGNIQQAGHQYTGILYADYGNRQGVDAQPNQPDDLAAEWHAPEKVYDFTRLVEYVAKDKFADHEALQRALARVDFDFADHVTLYTTDAVFVVHREIVVSNSLYFAGCFDHSFFNEDRTGKLHLTDDDPMYGVPTEDLLNYLWLIHDFYFHDLVHLKGAPCFRQCETLINEQKEQHGFDVPARSLSVMVGLLRLVDRFLHGPLLPLCRRLALMQMANTRSLWINMKSEVLDFLHPIHYYFLDDFSRAYDYVLVDWMGADRIRDALLEAFLQVIRYNDDLTSVVESHLLELNPYLFEDEIEFRASHPSITSVNWTIAYNHFRADKKLTIGDIQDMLFNRILRTRGNAYVTRTQEEFDQDSRDTLQRVLDALTRVKALKGKAEKDAKKKGKEKEAEKQDGHGKQKDKASAKKKSGGKNRMNHMNRCLPNHYRDRPQQEPVVCGKRGKVSFVPPSTPE